MTDVRDLIRYFKRADMHSFESDCVRRQIGAYLVDPLKIHHAMGFNKTPKGQSCSAGDCPRGKLSAMEKPHGNYPYDDCISMHAEISAIKEFPHVKNMKGWIMVVTAKPCDDCALVLRDRGIHVYWADPVSDINGFTLMQNYLPPRGHSDEQPRT